jgi:hypothetical protein
MATATTPPTPERKKHRSPAYPGINLKLAIERAEQFYDHERRNAASLAAAAAHWNYGLKSSGLLTTVAALKSFGLIDEVQGASGTARTIRLSEQGLRIVLDKRPDSAERQAAIKLAALHPKIHAELWRKYNGQLPSDVELKHRLVFDWKFNDNTVEDFVSELRETILFAKLTESDSISPDESDSELPEQELPIAKVGDYVQWESQGVLQFEAKRVREISEDGEWAWVEGSNTGMPMKQLTVVDAPLNAPPTPPPGHPPAPRIVVEEERNKPKPKLPLPAESGTLQDTFVLTEGPAAIQWPGALSKESYEDFVAWLEIVKRKIGRAVKSPTDASKGGE